MGCDCAHSGHKVRGGACGGRTETSLQVITIDSGQHRQPGHEH